MSLKKTEAYYISSDKKNKIRALIWCDDEVKPAGVFQIAHGLGEHIGRYDRLAEFMVSKGFAVCGNDHIGHGKSVADEDEPGDFGENDTYIRFIDDMHILHNIMVKRYPDVPYFLFGHSMGSFCARLYSAQFGDELKGAIFCGTGQFSEVLSLGEIPAQIIIEKIGKDKRTEAGNELFGWVTSKILGEKDTDAWLSLSRINRENYTNDDLVFTEMTLGSMLTLYKLSLKASSLNWFNGMNRDLPVMLISGANDPVGLFGRSVLKVADGLENRGIDVQMLLYPGMRHEILNEEDNDRVYDDIAKWVCEHNL